MFYNDAEPAREILRRVVGQERQDEKLSEMATRICNLLLEVNRAATILENSNSHLRNRVAWLEANGPFQANPVPGTDKYAKEPETQAVKDITLIFEQQGLKITRMSDGFLLIALEPK